MRVTKTSYPYIPLLLLIMLFFTVKKFLATLDMFGLFTNKRDRLQEAIEKDREKLEINSQETIKAKKQTSKRWYDYITTQTFGYMGNTNFLNRTKASLRLDYDPIIDPEEARKRSLAWFRDHVEL